MLIVRRKPEGEPGEPGGEPGLCTLDARRGESGELPPKSGVDADGLSGSKLSGDGVPVELKSSQSMVLAAAWPTFGGFGFAPPILGLLARPAGAEDDADRGLAPRELLLAAAGADAAPAPRGVLGD